MGHFHLEPSPILPSFMEVVLIYSRARALSFIYYSTLLFNYVRFIYLKAVYIRAVKARNLVWFPMSIFK